MTVSKVRVRLRQAAVFYGIAFFIWLPIEDHSMWPAVIFGAVLAALLVILGVLDKMSVLVIPAPFLPIAAALWGALNGLSASLATTGVMFLKNALHGHIFPDYPPGLMFAMLQRAPAWAAAGGLFGLGLALLRLAAMRRS